MSSDPLNRTEALVLEVCQRSFLSLWCNGNPRASDQKELFVYQTHMPAAYSLGADAPADEILKMSPAPTLIVISFP